MHVFLPTVPLVPLRANRSVFLPLWNNVDYSGETWREAPPSEDEDRQEEQEKEEDEEDGYGRVFIVLGQKSPRYVSCVFVHQSFVFLF